MKEICDCKLARAEKMYNHWKSWNSEELPEFKNLSQELKTAWVMTSLNKTKEEHSFNLDNHDHDHLEEPKPKPKPKPKQSAKSKTAELPAPTNNSEEKVLVDKILKEVEAGKPKKVVRKHTKQW